ncbi:hypothetical protein F5B18DRAFT_31867 [Nemania serpens]|nr:hypothetical protein F5B18DRAFT_31867 [Nemania serpens]
MQYILFHLLLLQRGLYASFFCLALGGRGSVHRRTSLKPFRFASLGRLSRGYKAGRGRDSFPSLCHPGGSQSGLEEKQVWLAALDRRFRLCNTYIHTYSAWQ